MACAQTPAILWSRKGCSSWKVQQSHIWNKSHWCHCYRLVVLFNLNFRFMIILFGSISTEYHQIHWGPFDHFRRQWHNWWPRWILVAAVPQEEAKIHPTLPDWDHVLNRYPNFKSNSPRLSIMECSSCLQQVTKYAPPIKTHLSYTLLTTFLIRS